MSLIKEIHSDVLRNQLHPDESREKRHAFLTGVHSSAATIGRYKERGEQLDTAIEEINAVITDLDNGKVQKADWESVLSRAKSAVRMAKEALGIGVKEPPPVVQDLTAEEFLELLGVAVLIPKVRLAHNSDYEEHDGAAVAAAETILKELKNAGYVRLSVLK